ncbi:hypothetical protein SAMN04488077_1362 [Roseovarius tolerans]|uniref:Lipoprotein n=1 Tax=Roseovarius tolerans TaxID=74031 RepID=A0A1H8JS31_9RHOB|nr:hypothetical protein [Roseovarius tolerans]SEN83381.1 hypothetical protein SAMN04488077_1362 [Roseovarius tolerans]
MRSLVLALGAMVFLAGCATESVWAPDDAVARAAYRHDGPPRLTVYTMINNNSGGGAHTSLMINGSQRVIFDPAGSFKHDTIPERNDVLFGITPPVEDVYTRYHARKTYHVQIQRLDVSPELAERAIQLVKANGPVPSAQCSLATSRILGELLPGQIRSSWFPRKTAEDFGNIPGVTEEKLYEYDGDDNSNVLAAWDPARAKAQ